MAQVTIKFSIEDATAPVTTTGNICPVVNNQVGAPLNDSPFSVNDTHDNSFVVPGPGRYTYAFLIGGNANFTMSATRMDTGDRCGHGVYSTGNGVHDHLNFWVQP